MTANEPTNPSARSTSADSRRGFPPPPKSPNQNTQAEQTPSQQEEEQKEEKETPNKQEQPTNPTTENPSSPADPPLPDEELPPPLPNEAPPDQEDDGWEPVWDVHTQAYYFYNRFTGISQWENPRIPDASAPGTSTDANSTPKPKPKPKPVAGGYNPAIHGDYDPTAPYAQQYEEDEDTGSGAAPGMADPSASYAASGAFNRFTGRWQDMSVTPENYNDENKSRRQMSAFFDVDAAANSHDGRSLRAERSAKKLSRKELKMFKEKRREKKEEKRRAWLRD